jgi:Xaa-Pro dipeptidase
MFSSRLKKLTLSLVESGLDAIALNPGASLVYLTGLHFHLMERPTVVIFTRDSTPVIILPELELQKLEGLPFKVSAFSYGDDPGEWEGVFRKAVISLGLDGRQIGVETRQMRLLEFNYLRAGAPKAVFPDASQVVSRLRIHKDDAEVAEIRKAVRIAQNALEAVIPLINIGMTEEELAGELLLQLLRSGTQPDLSFSPIVSAGPNSANPHANPSRRKLAAGDLLVIDWGALSGGYVSDLTRTFAVGEVEEEFVRIHRIVQAANAAGREAGKPGVSCSEVDSAARRIITDAGYGVYFTHRTGHGIGMEGHEEPYIRSNNSMILEPGMCFTVEPGIYLPGRNGVRIEDNVVITTSGNDCLSDMPREIRVVG